MNRFFGFKYVIFLVILGFCFDSHAIFSFGKKDLEAEKRKDARKDVETLSTIPPSDKWKRNVNNKLAKNLNAAIGTRTPISTESSRKLKHLDVGHSARHNHSAQYYQTLFDSKDQIFDDILSGARVLDAKPKEDVLGPNSKDVPRAIGSGGGDVIYVRLRNGENRTLYSKPVVSASYPFSAGVALHEDIIPFFMGAMGILYPNASYRRYFDSNIGFMSLCYSPKALKKQNVMMSQMVRCVDGGQIYHLLLFINRIEGLTISLI